MFKILKLKNKSQPKLKKTFNKKKIKTQKLMKRKKMVTVRMLGNGWDPTRCTPWCSGGFAGIHGGGGGHHPCAIWKLGDVQRAAERRDDVEAGEALLGLA